MTALTTLAAALYAASLLLMALQHVRDPGRNVLRDPVSDYGVGPARRLFQLNGAVGALGGLVLAGIFVQRGLPTWIAACLGASVLARLGVAAFPTDLEGAPRTTAGRLHMLFAIASFALVYTVIDNATPLLASTLGGAWGATLGALHWVAAAGLAALVACLVLRPLRGWFGLAERVFLIAVPLWMLVVSLALGARA